MDITTGDDIEIAITLKTAGATFAINSAAIVKAAIVTKAGGLTLAGPVLVSNATLGSNWQNSLIVVAIPGKATKAIKNDMMAKLEIQVDDGGKKTWIANIRLIKGGIK